MNDFEEIQLKLLKERVGTLHSLLEQGIVSKELIMASVEVILLAGISYCGREFSPLHALGDWVIARVRIQSGYCADPECNNTITASAAGITGLCRDCLDGAYKETSEAVEKLDNPHPHLRKI